MTLHPSLPCQCVHEFSSMSDDSFRSSVKFIPVTQDCTSNHRSSPFVSGTPGYIWSKWRQLQNMLVSHGYRSLHSPIPIQCQLYGPRGEEIKGKYITTLGRVLQMSGNSLHWWSTGEGAKWEVGSALLALNNVSTDWCWKGHWVCSLTLVDI